MAVKIPMIYFIQEMRENRLSCGCLQAVKRVHEVGFNACLFIQTSLYGRLFFHYINEAGIHNKTKITEQEF